MPAGPVSGRSHLFIITIILQYSKSLSCVYVCVRMMYGGGMHAMLYMWRSERSFVESLLSSAFTWVPEYELGVIRPMQQSALTTEPPHQPGIPSLRFTGSPGSLPSIVPDTVSQRQDTEHSNPVSTPWLPSGNRGSPFKLGFPSPPPLT